MPKFMDMLNKKAKEWNCPDMLDSVKDNIPKIPFSSPLLNYATYGGIPRGRVIEFHGEPGGGKAQPLDSLVLTTSGYKKMGDIVVGDEVITHKGNTGHVVGIFPQGKRPTYQIVLQDGAKIAVADNHLNIVVQPGANSEKVVTTDLLIEHYPEYAIPVANLGDYLDKLGLFDTRRHSTDRKIACIDYLGEQECQCIYIDHEDHTYISDNFIPTHNTSTCLDLCYSAVQIFKEEHEAKVQEYRELIAKGKKEYAGPLEDLIDCGPKAVVYWDLEHSFDWQWAKKMNLNKGDIIVAQPPDISGEAICQTIEDTMSTGEVGLIVMDSIPSLVTQAELDKKYGERTVSSLAGLMTTFMRKITPICSRYDCTLLLVNQTRDNMDNPYVTQTPGGQAVKFYCTTRLYFRRGKPVDFAGNELPTNVENPSGYLINVKIVKQKGAPFDRKVASYFLMADSGIRPDFDYALLAINKYNIIMKKGAWFTLCDPTTGEILEEDGKPIKLNGLVKVYDYLASHSDYYNTLKTYITNDINGVDADMSEALPEDVPYDSYEKGDAPEEA